MKTECGLFGSFINNKVSKEDLWFSLAEIQHRGQDSYGYLSIHPSTNTGTCTGTCTGTIDTDFEVKIKKEKGLLPNIDSLNLNVDGGIIFLGHMRYSTNTTVENLNNSITECNIQPVEISRKHGIYIAHNGNLPNLKDNMRKLGLGSYYKNGMSDTYLFKVIWKVKFAGKFEQDGKICKLEDILEYLKYIVLNVVGAYSCVMTFCEPISHSNSRFSNSNSISSSSSDTSDSSNDDINSNYKYYLFGFRDRYGYKPLSIGKLLSNDQQQSTLPKSISESSDITGNINYCFFSESIQLQDKKYFIRDVGPGEIWYSKMNNEPSLLGRITENQKKEIDCEPRKKYGFFCSLEAIYFMKKDTILFNGETTVNNFRRRLGMELAKQDIANLANKLNPVNQLEYEYEARQILKKRAILYMPESAFSIGQGYSEIIDSRIHSDLISKVQNIRSFIENNTEAREGKLKRKFAFNDAGIAALGNTEIVLIDDTIVRGNSMRYIIGELYKRNPDLKIHVRIGSPRIIKGCSFGIDLYDDELIATQEQNLATWLGIASVEFLDISKLAETFARYGIMNCQYCFGITHKNNKKTLEW
jgi:glutamine phosphoribosylpyrophosphate amidotransferase